MIELTSTEVDTVSGAGFIQDSLSSIGGSLGNAGYNLIGSQLNVTLPIIGNISLPGIAPNLGRNVGSTIGNAIGGAVESTLAKTPLIGGLINKLLGN